MPFKRINNSRPAISRALFLPVLFLLHLLAPVKAAAHQTPTTIVLLDVSPGRVAMELQLPVPELELAFGHAITKDPEHMLVNYGPQLQEYLKAHIHPYIAKDKPWLVEVVSMRMDKGVQQASGPAYWEVVASLLLKPQPGENTRSFMLDYDVIMHQVVNHVAFVSIRNDWETGTTNEQPVEAGVIRVDTKDNLIYPLAINLQKGSWWKGFGSMLRLGMQHIKEGTDHLLFLLVLLLPAMLVTNANRWAGFGGTRYSVTRLLKIVTAFTIGHSVTLIIGALGWLHLPARPVEVMIAFSILISAVHAIYPVFPGKEVYVAAGFGLIHGLAFASILASLNLGAGAMALSILGFNLGIEAMQLIIITLIVPWLMLLSQTPLYKWFRTGGAVLAGTAAIAWIGERITGDSNFITKAIESLTPYAKWGVAALAVVAVVSYWVYRKPAVQ